MYVCIALKKQRGGQDDEIRERKCLKKNRLFILFFMIGSGDSGERERERDRETESEEGVKAEAMQTEDARNE